MLIRYLAFKAFYVHKCFAYMYVYKPGIHEGQKEGSGHSLELETAVSHEVGARTQTWVFCKKNKCS